MASIINRPGGHRWIQFNLDGKRRTLKLGKRSRDYSEEVFRRVRSILECRAAGMPLQPSVISWLAEIDDDLHKRMVSAGLVEPREITRLSQFLERYLGGLKKKSTGTLRNHRIAIDRLIGHFTAVRDIRTITIAEAETYAARLGTELADSTAGREIRRVKEYFAHALARKLLVDNPFASVKGVGDPDPDRNAYVTREASARVLDACTSNRWRLIFALARFAGLRVPSELATLTWDKILWDESVMMVLDGKKKTYRRVPIAPELRHYLDIQWDAAASGEVKVLPDVAATSNLGTSMDKFVLAAGLPPWPKTFVNLRASCETDWMRKHPLHAVCSWIGHSPTTALKHYARVTAEDERAAAEKREVNQEATGSKMGSSSLSPNPAESHQEVTQQPPP